MEEYNLMYNIYQQSRRQTETITELRRLRDESETRPLLETAFLVKPNGESYLTFALIVNFFQVPIILILLPEI